MTDALLLEHLRQGASRPFAWGVCDCTSWVCDWVRQTIGADPLEPGRSRYRTALGAARHVRRAGGGDLLAAVKARMAAVRLTETDSPLPGDVGVVMSTLGPMMAIRTGRGWAAKGPIGIVSAPFPVLAAWRVPPLTRRSNRAHDGFV